MSALSDLERRLMYCVSELGGELIKEDDAGHYRVVLSHNHKTDLNTGSTQTQARNYAKKCDPSI
jgi:hypothetical protein